MRYPFDNSFDAQQNAIADFILNKVKSEVAAELAKQKITNVQTVDIRTQALEFALRTPQCQYPSDVLDGAKAYEKYIKGESNE